MSPEGIGTVINGVFSTESPCDGFRKARRILRLFIVNHSLGLILIQSRDNAQLVILTRDDSALDDLSRAAEAWPAGRMAKPLRLPTPSAG